MRPSGDGAARTLSRAKREEVANALSHGLGIVLSAVGGSVLVLLAVASGDAWKVVGSSVFGISLLLLYSASTVYHATVAPRLKQKLKVLDHAAIYLLIAGTYTPFTLVSLRGGWGWSLFGVIWGLAAAGVVFKVFFTGRMNRLSTAIYVAMGWMILIAVVPLVRELAFPALAWLVAGGVLYTAGTAFYHARRIPYAHAVWHGFVLMGSACHVFAVASQT